MAGSIKNIALLGATGSIGLSTLDVIARHPDKYRAAALCANSKVDELLNLCAKFKPDIAVIVESDAYPALRDGLKKLGLSTQAMCGSQALSDVAAAPEFDTVLAAIVGAAGMRVDLKPRSMPFQTVNAKVTRIAPQATVGKVQSTINVCCQPENGSPTVYALFAR